MSPCTIGSTDWHMNEHIRWCSVVEEDGIELQQYKSKYNMKSTVLVIPIASCNGFNYFFSSESCETADQLSILDVYHSA
jgi:hypothetical protein